MSSIVSPQRLIGCDDVELGKPYNLTVLHSYNCTFSYTFTLLNSAFVSLHCYNTLHGDPNRMRIEDLGRCCHIRA